MKQKWHYTGNSFINSDTPINCCSRYWKVFHYSHSQTYISYPQSKINIIYAFLITWPRISTRMLKYDWYSKLFSLLFIACVSKHVQFWRNLCVVLSWQFLQLKLFIFSIENALISNLSCYVFQAITKNSIVPIFLWLFYY